MHVFQSLNILLLLPLISSEGCTPDDQLQVYRLMPGTGYNIATGTPLEPEDRGLVPGQVFSYPKNSQGVTKWIDPPLKSTKLDESGCPQWGWKYPDSSDWGLGLSDGLSGISTSQAINSQKSYQKENGLHFEESASGVTEDGLALEFTASQEFKSKTREFENNSRQMIRIARQASAYTSSVHYLTAEVDDSYWEAVIRAYIDGDMTGFIDAYGTHFIVQVTGGARVELITHLDTHDYQRVSSNEESFKTGLKAWYETVTAGVSEHDDHTEEQVKYVQSVTKSHEMNCRGGDSNCQFETDDPNDMDSVNSFWNSAYKYPQMLHAKLYPHDTFIAGKSAGSDFRWKEMQKFMDTNYHTVFRLTAPMKLVRSDFINYWAVARQKYCTTYVGKTGKQINSCEPLTNPLPANLRIDYASKTTLSVGTEHNQQSYNKHHPPTGPVKVEALESYSNWLQVVRIDMRCYKKQPMMLKFYLGDHVSPPREFHMVGQDEANKECNWDNDCSSDQVTMADHLGIGCGSFWLQQCAWCCNKHGDNEMKLTTLNLAANDLISGVQWQSAKVTHGEEGETKVTRLMFEVVRGSDSTNIPELFGCEGDLPGSLLPPQYFDWRHHRLLNYQGSTTSYGQIANLEISLYRLAGAEEVLAFHAINSDNNQFLHGCVSDVFHTDVHYHKAGKWSNTKSGSDVCKEMGYQGCDVVIAKGSDGSCLQQDCSYAVETSKAVGCLLQHEPFQLSSSSCADIKCTAIDTLLECNRAVEYMKLPVISGIDFSVSADTTTDGCFYNNAAQSLVVTDASFAEDSHHVCTCDVQSQQPEESLSRRNLLAEDETEMDNIKTPSRLLKLEEFKI